MDRALADTALEIFVRRLLAGFQIGFQQDVVFLDRHFDQGGAQFGGLVGIFGGNLDFVEFGAQLLIVPTNTSSYASAQVPTQEIAASEVQAVQQGRDLLQAAPTGYSAWITHRGVLLDRSVLGSREIVAATLERRVGLTVYVRYGDTPVLALAAVVLAVAWALAVRHRGRRTRGAGGATVTR